MNLQSGKCSQAAGQAAFTCVPRGAKSRSESKQPLDFDTEAQGGSVKVLVELPPQVWVALLGLILAQPSTHLPASS